MRGGLMAGNEDGTLDIYRERVVLLGKRRRIFHVLAIDVATFALVGAAGSALAHTFVNLCARKPYDELR